MARAPEEARGDYQPLLLDSSTLHVDIGVTILI